MIASRATASDEAATQPKLCGASAGTRTLPLQTGNAIHEWSGRVDQLEHINQDLAEILDTRSPNMGGGLAQPGDASEQVLDGTSIERHGMSLQLGKVDDQVSLENRLCKDVVAVVQLLPDGTAEWDEPSTAFCCSLSHTGLSPEHTVFLDRIVGRVADPHLAAGLGCKFRHCLHEDGVGADCPFRGDGGQQVGFEQHSHARPDKMVDAAEGCEAGGDRLVD